MPDDVVAERLEQQREGAVEVVAVAAAAALQDAPRGVVRVDRRRAAQLDLERLVRDPLDLRGVQRVQALDARWAGVLDAQAAQVGGAVQGPGHAAQTAAVARIHRTTRKQPGGGGRDRDVDRRRLAHPRDEVVRLQPLQLELERQRLRARAVAAQDVERPAGRVQRVVRGRLAVGLQQQPLVALVAHAARHDERRLAGDPLDLGAQVLQQRERRRAQPAVGRAPAGPGAPASSPMPGSIVRPRRSSAADGSGTISPVS